MIHNNKYRPLKFIAISIFLLLPLIPLKAQNVKNISLQQAIELSVKSSKKLKIANAKIDEAIANYHIAKDNRLPDLKASGTYMRLNNPDVSLKIKLGSSQAKPISVNEVSYASVNLSIPVFSGFKIKYGIESAKYLEMATKLDADNDKEELIQTIINAYCNLYKAKKTVDLIKENLKQQEKRVTDFSNLEKNGLLARNDLLKAQLQKSNIELTLLDAENNLKITNINMDLLLDMPEDVDLIPDTMSFHDISYTGTVIEWEDKAFHNRKDIASITYKEKAAIVGIKAAKSDYFPGLAVTGGLIEANIPGLLTISNAANIGVGLQYNFASLWKTSAKVAASKAREQQVLESQNMLADQIRMQINQAYENYILCTRKIDVYNVALDQAMENYRISRNKYNNSLLTLTDLLEADVAQLQAKLNYTFAQADAFVAYKKLEQTAGLLSGNYIKTNK